MYACYLQAVRYYKDVCAPTDSVYDVIDLLSIGVLFQRSKAEFLPALETIVEKLDSQDGLIDFLLRYLQGRPLNARQSQLDYFNVLMESENKLEILSLELSRWYQHHKDAYWYNSHNSKNNTYCGYWCFEIAALVKILGVDDTSFAADPYYPCDLARL